MDQHTPGNTIHLIGNAHLDPVWLWRWQEGYAEIKATFRSALDRLNEFPSFVFTSACAGYYAWVEENNPSMFKEIQIRVQEGRWAIAGGMWIQPDCNIPSGESFARHALYSQRYFQDRFGKTAKTGYNVDSFGHNANLPQLLKLSGMDSYVMMRPSSVEKPDLQETLFIWESPSGAQVTTFRIPNAYGHLYRADQSPEVMDISSYRIQGEQPEELKLRESITLANQLNQPLMNFYGVGNHGGGPTVANLEMLGKYINESKVHTPDQLKHVVMSSPDQYFEEVRNCHLDVKVTKGDLHHHASGCYSAHSLVKAKNRQSEHRLITAEKLITLAAILTGENESFPTYRQQLKKGWERVMFNQFHDIMGGCSIKQAYADTLEWYGEVLSLSASVLNSAIQKISWEIDTMPEGAEKAIKNQDWVFWEQNNAGAPLIVFNPHTWPVKAEVQMNRAVSSISDHRGNVQSVQRIRGSYMNGTYRWNSLFMADLPAFGYKLYWVYRDKKSDDAAKERRTEYRQSGSIENELIVKQLDISATEPNHSYTVIENKTLRLTINESTGYVASLYNKELHREFIDVNAAVPIVIDITHCDTWAHGVYEFRNEVGRFTDAEVTVLESGPVRAKIRVKSSYHRSVMIQDFILYAEKNMVEVEVRLDWQEEHKMLKLSFPVKVSDPVATHEIPYGHITRAANGCEVPSQQWVDISGSDGGISLLNDSKYSFDVKNNELRMTVANSSLYADHFGERDGLGEFMDTGVQNFVYALVPHAEKWQEAGIIQLANELNSKPVSILETYHKGSLPRETENIHISAASIIASVFKRAENNEGFVLRCYETIGVSTETTISITPVNRSWKTSFGHNEIKTFFIPDSSDKEIQEVNFIEW